MSTATLRTVRPGHEAAFEKALKDFFEQTRDVPGQLGIHVVRPVPGSGSRDYGILRTFADQQAHDDFFNSPEFAEWQVLVAPMMEGAAAREVRTGLETWFTLPGAQAMVPPPRWKMGLASMLAGFLTAGFLGLTLGPYLSTLHLAARTVIMSGLMSVIMTWVLMPVLARVLKGWLYAASQR